MAKGGFSIKHTKYGRSYTYTGDLRAAINKAENELETKEADTTKRAFLAWDYDRAKNALDAWERRISDLRGFIAAAKNELRKQEEAGESGTE